MSPNSLAALSRPVTVSGLGDPATLRAHTAAQRAVRQAVRSTASTIDEVIAEVAASRVTERGATRADDRFTEAAMEDRKKEGYF